MNLNQFKSIFVGRQIKYSQLKKILNVNLQLKKQLEDLYRCHSDRFSFKVFVKYFILNKFDKCCKTCGKLLSYKQIKDGRNYCSNRCSNSDNLVKQKIKKTNLQRYGVISATKLPNIIEKMKKTNVEKYGCQWASQRFKKCKVVQNSDNIVKDNGAQFAYQQQMFNLNYDYSKIKEQIFLFLHEQTGEQCILSCRRLINEQIVDVYCPNKKIACQLIETRCQFSRSYNVKKIEWCDDNGIRILHILADQWINKKQIVKDRIKSVIGVFDERVLARKCQVRQVCVSQCRRFLSANHIQGSDLSKVKLGLYFDNVLVSVMTFGKPRFNHDYEWQLIRYATKLGTQVVGGASKLLKYFERKYKPQSIISYADRRYSNGKLYYALGFCFVQNSQPNYWWCKNDIKLSRYQCQKHKLGRLLGEFFNQKLSQNLNMKNNGYVKVYDCGNMVFEKIIFKK